MYTQNVEFLCERARIFHMDSITFHVTCCVPSMEFCFILLMWCSKSKVSILSFLLTFEFFDFPLDAASVDSYATGVDDRTTRTDSCVMGIESSATRVDSCVIKVDSCGARVHACSTRID